VAIEIAERHLRKYGKSKNFKSEEGNYTVIDKCFIAYYSKIATNGAKWLRIGELIKKQKGAFYDGTEKY